MASVGRHVAHGAIWAVVVPLVLIGMFVLLVHPRVFNTNTYVDSNGGDTCVEMTVCGLRVWDRIRTTPFSREVRRLGIPVPKDRAWQLALEKRGMLMGTEQDLRFCRVLVNLELLMETLSYAEVSDQELRGILERILVSLKDSKLAMREVSALVAEMERRIDEQRKNKED